MDSTRSAVKSVMDSVKSASSFEASYAVLKPANLINILVRFFKTNSWRERCGCVIQLLELYGCFWAISGSSSSAISDSIAYLMYRLPRMFTSFRDLVDRLTTRTPQSNDPTFESHADTNQDVSRVDAFFATCSTFVQDMWNKAKEQFTEHREGLYSVAIIVIPIVLLACCFFGSSFGTGARVCSSVIACGNLIRNWKIITDGFVSLRTVVSETTAHIFGMDITNKFKEELAAKIKLLKENIDSKNVLLDTDLSTALDDADFILDIEKHLKEVDALYIEISTTDKNLMNFRFQMDDVRTAASELKRKHHILMTSITGKVHPTVLWLYGKSGVGKSHCVDAVLRGLQQCERRTLTKFSRHCGDQYWSGYCGDDAVIYDDFGADTENIDHVELDAIYSSANYPLNMADITSKGKRFVSPYVIICSNFAFIDKSKRLLQPSILDRRRDFLFEVEDVVNTAYRTRGRQPPSDHFKEDYSHVKFRELALAPVNGTVSYTGRNWGLGAIIEHMYKRKCERVDAYKKTLEGVCESFRDGVIDEDDKAQFPNGISIADPAAWAQFQSPVAPPDDVDLTDVRPTKVSKSRLAGAAEWLRPRMADANVTTFESFKNHAHVRMRTILLIGDAGTRKTTIARAIGAKFPHVEVIDEFCDRLSEVENRVWKCYDNYTDSDIPMILCCNSTTLRTHWDTAHPDDHQRMDAFLRRCFVFSFELQHKLFRKVRAGDITTENYSKNVAINVYKEHKLTCTFQSTSEVISHISSIVSQLPVPIPVLSTSLARVTLPADCDYVISVNSLVADVGQASFENFHLIKGSTTAIMSLMPTLYKLRSRQYATCEDALIGFNEAKIKEPHVALLRFQDVAFLFKPDAEGYSVAYKVALDGQLEEWENKCIANDNRNEVMQWLDLLLHLLKSLAISYFCTYYPVVTPLQSEGWAEDMDKVDPIGKREEHWSYTDPQWVIPTVPKSRLQSRDQQKEYCEFHHCMDYCLSTESRTIRRMHEVYDQAPTSVVQDVLKSETSDEEDQRKRPVTRFKVANETSDEEDQRKRPVTRFKVANETSDEEDQRKRPVTRFKADDTEVRSLPRIPVKNYKMTSQNQVSVKNEVLKDQSSYDPQALSIAMVFNDNIVSVGDRDRPSLSALMLRGRLGVTNAHVDYSLDVGAKLQVNTLTETWIATVVQKNDLRDLLFFTLPQSSRQFRDVTPHLMPRGEIKDFSNLAGLMITRRKEVIVWRTLELKMEKTIDVEQRKRHGLLYTGTCTGMSYGTMLTERGDCGSPVLVLDPTRKHKLLGFHSAASAMTGLGTLIYVDDLPNIDFDNQCAEEIVVLQHQAIRRVEQDDYKLFKVFGMAEENGKALKQFHPYTTMLYKSPFAGFLPEYQYEPAILDIKDTRLPTGSIPYEEAMDKWSHEQPFVDMEELAIVTDCVAEYLAQKVYENNYSFGVLTKTEAINGVSSIPASNPMYLRSSAGYPFKHWAGVTKKVTFFSPDGPNGTYVIAKTPLGQKLNVAVDALIETARRGQRSAVVFCGSLKDEALKTKKIYGENRATRSFAGSPVDYTVAHRMYFHGAMAAIASIHDQVPPQVGIDPCSVDWHTMCRRLMAVSDQGFDVDFSGWDATVPKVFMQALPKIYNTIYQYCDPKYTPEDDVIRTNLHSVLHGPLVMYYDAVVQCPGGQVSGQPATSMDNCIVNMLYHYYIWRQLAKTHAPDKLGYTSFLKNVASAFYGDDDITTVSPECMSWFNLSTFQVEATKLGLVVTDAMKTTKTDLVPIKPLMEMNFLKRNFRRIGKFIVGALEDCVFAKMTALCKIHKGHHWYLERENVQFDPQTITSTIDSALHEASLKGEQFYNEIVAHFRKCCRDYAIRYEFYPSWQEVFNSAMGLSSCVKLKRLEMYAELDINNEGLTSNHVIQHSASSPGRFRNDRGKLRGKFGGPKSNASSESSSETGSGDSWNAKQQHRPVHLHEFPVHGNLNMVNCCAPRNNHIQGTNTPKQDELNHFVFEQDIQHLGRWLSVPHEVGWHWFPCRSIGLGTYTTKCRPNNFDNRCRSDSIRVGYCGPKTVGIDNNFHDRSEELDVSLQRVRRNRSCIIWRMVCTICDDAIEYIIYWLTTDQFDNLVQGRSIIHCRPDNSTSNCNNSWRSGHSASLVSRTTMEGSIHFGTHQYSGSVDGKCYRSYVWSSGLYWGAHFTAISTTASVWWNNSFQWTRCRRTSYDMGRSRNRKSSTTHTVYGQFWSCCPRIGWFHEQSHEYNSSRDISEQYIIRTWSEQAIHCASDNMSAICSLSRRNKREGSSVTISQRISRVIQGELWFTRCRSWWRTSIARKPVCYANSRNDSCSTRTIKRTDDERNRIFVCAPRQRYRVGSTIPETQLKRSAFYDKVIDNCVVRYGVLHNRGNWFDCRHRSSTNQPEFRSKRFVVVDEGCREDETILCHRGSEEDSTDEPMSCENVEQSVKRRRLMALEAAGATAIKHIATDSAAETGIKQIGNDISGAGRFHQGNWGSGTNSLHSSTSNRSLPGSGSISAHQGSEGATPGSSISSNRSNISLRPSNVDSQTHDGGFSTQSSHHVGSNAPEHVRLGRGSTFAPTRSAHTIGLTVPAAVHGAFNLAGTTSSAKISGQNTINAQNNSFNNAMKGYNYTMNQKVGAYNQAGLPSYLAYGSGSGAGLPPTSQVQHGSNTYTSHLAGNPQSSAFTGALSQTAAGWGNIL